MDKEVKASWERFLNPVSLKNNIITASVHSMAFEMLKSSIEDKIREFFTNGFDENGPLVSDDYKLKVLKLNRSRTYASLLWLKQHDAIDDADIEVYERIKRHRNELTHELFKFASQGCDFDVAKSFDDMVGLLRKIEIWWFVNLEMAIDPESYPADLDLDEVVPGRLWSLQMLISTALGSEEDAMKFYNEFVQQTET
ncbi:MULTISPECIES: hypothetical protein [Vibrionaceae]|jgi:hypothetical protein|nr:MULTISPECIES: hypothetical protein [Vibrionaceae]HDM8240813.1 hypothetical protein [Vibrio campbellii]EJE4556939.1 hypothetical protein [Vibrio parahaemolyticus]EJL6388315.1 hypothetical protein [Vibrio parahaemolyticus]EKC5524348.1 hypothetical protein [Vibrio parahaemolyticus]ELB1514601.1 hypothetical protein [Vibrio alginolyticus]